MRDGGLSGPYSGRPPVQHKRNPPDTIFQDVPSHLWKGAKIRG